MTLQQQLEYFWERGFYSVVKDGDRYGIFSTKDKEGKLRYCYANSIDVAKTLIGQYQSTQFGYPDEEDISMMRFRGTIHPSELMGKGFQVGDKVEYKGVKMVVEGSMYIGSQPYYFCEGQKTRFSPLELKPVLPVEENKNCMKCGVYVSENDIGVIRTETDYLCCLSCDREVNKVIELLKKTKVITDGKIVNF